MNSSRAWNVRVKLAVIKDAEDSRNISATARKHNIHPRRLQRWIKQKQSILQTMKRNPAAKNVMRNSIHNDCFLEKIKGFLVQALLSSTVQKNLKNILESLGEQTFCSNAEKKELQAIVRRIKALSI